MARLLKRRAFAPSPGLTLAALVLCALFVRLGVWQWHKGALAQERWSAFARGADRLLSLGAGTGSALPPFQRVTVTGQLDAAHQFLLDNRSLHGLPGYEVLTPLARAGAPALLVDRGWVPFTGRRAELPPVGFAAPDSVTLSGRLADLPSPGLSSGRAAPPSAGPWPRLTSFPVMAELAAALGTPLAPRLLLLDPAQPFGYLRDWQPPGLPPLRHLSYAIQWWAFAFVTLGGWALLSTRRRAQANA